MRATSSTGPGPMTAALIRSFDVVCAGIGLLLLLPVFVIVGLAVRWTSPGPVFYLQQRVGKGFAPFSVFKFRTMVQDSEAAGRQITAAGDPRITKLGHLLRKFKIDELPQLFNVLRGDMSLVGPRPEVPRYVEMFREDFADILKVRPGITDLASLKFCDESSILGRAADPEREYVERVLPEKIDLAKSYVRHASLWLNIKLIFFTIYRILGGSVNAANIA